ncbi:MAG: hypothetical protein RR851_12385, partial [Clostridium sp.]
MLFLFFTHSTNGYITSILAIQLRCFLFCKTFCTKIVDNLSIISYNKFCQRGVAQMGARVVWDHEV